MNYTQPSPHHAKLNMSVVATAMAVSLAVLMIVTIIVFAYYLCHRVPAAYLPRASPIGDGAANLRRRRELQVLDEASLLNYPYLRYTQAKIIKRDTMACCCSICLADYKDTDVLRLLPYCDHIFHQRCIDSWLLLRSTCPLCRNNAPPPPPPPPVVAVSEESPVQLRS